MKKLYQWSPWTILYYPYASRRERIGMKILFRHTYYGEDGTSPTISPIWKFIAKIFLKGKIEILF